MKIGLKKKNTEKNFFIVWLTDYNYAKNSTKQRSPTKWRELLVSIYAKISTKWKWNVQPFLSKLRKKKMLYSVFQNNLLTFSVFIPSSIYEILHQPLHILQRMALSLGPNIY